MPDLTEAVQLSDPLELPDPIPHAECTICVALGKQREEARQLRDLTAVSDCNVEIRRHHHQARP